MLIYFAAPLFCQAEREFNLRLTNQLENQGFNVFLPQRDGIELLKPPYNEMTSDELCQAIFELDRDKILDADIFFIVLDGQVPDEGACVELGIAFSQKHLLKKDKLLIGLHTDVRGTYSNMGSKLNAMIVGALDFVVNDVNELLAMLTQYRNTKVGS